MQQGQVVGQVIPALQVGIQEPLVKDIEAAIPEEVLLMHVAVVVVQVAMAVQVKAVMQAKAAWADKLELPEILLGMQVVVLVEVTGLQAVVVVAAPEVVVAVEEIIQAHTDTIDSFNLVTPVTANQELVVVAEQADTTAAFRTATAAKVAPE
jgi:hypothetical protein